MKEAQELSRDIKDGLWVVDIRNGTQWANATTQWDLGLWRKATQLDRPTELWPLIVLYPLRPENV